MKRLVFLYSSLPLLLIFLYIWTMYCICWLTLSRTLGQKTKLSCCILIVICYAQQTNLVMTCHREQTMLSRCTSAVCLIWILVPTAATGLANY